jgi:hypothetical protein
MGPIPITQRIRQGSAAIHLDVFTSSPGPDRAGVPVAHFPEAFDFVDAAGDRCVVLPAVGGTLRCASLYPGGEVVRTYDAGFWADAACTQRLFYGSPRFVEPSLLRVGLYADGGVLSAVSTVKAHSGPVYRIEDEVCVPRVSDIGLLALDRKTEASTLPIVFETTL